MSFLSFAFVVLFVVVLIARGTVGRRSNCAVFLWFLLIVSLVFYAWHRPSYLLLVFASAGVDFIAGLLLSQPGRTKAYRRSVLALSMSLNLGLLGFFKYTNFALDSAGTLSAWIGFGRTWLPTLNVALPIGISFYTFQSMSYTIDVYRGHLPATRSLSRFFLCVTFFPHLVAGPIVRARDLLHQFDRPRRIRWPFVLEGGWLMIRGFFLKMVLADNIAVYLSGSKGNSIGAWDLGYTPGADAGLLWLAVVLFSVQIYSDFAGYSDIARGIAYLVGLRLPINFNYPYIAGSFSEFWRRWHITLSSWLRDYLFLPLSYALSRRMDGVRWFGIRDDVWIYGTATMITMLLAGLWHGAAWTFVIWGGIHGGALAIERALGLPLRRRRKSSLASRASRAAGQVLWFVIVQFTVMVAWVIFRCDSITHARTFLANLATGPWSSLDLRGQAGLMLLLIAPAVIMHVRTFAEESLRLPRASTWERAVVAGLLVYVTASWYGQSNDFIYFQF